MARLIARINTDRNGRSGWNRLRGYVHSSEKFSGTGEIEQTHRLGNTWVAVETANWDISIRVEMLASGLFIVNATDLVTGDVKVLQQGNLEDLFGRIPPERKANGHRKMPRVRKPRPKKPPKLTKQQTYVNSLFGGAA